MNPSFKTPAFDRTKSFGMNSPWNIDWWVNWGNIWLILFLLGLPSNSQNTRAPIKRKASFQTHDYTKFEEITYEERITRYEKQVYFKWDD